MLKYLFLFISTLLLSDTGKLIKIVDGDTLYFKTNGKKVKCRIEYIDTPESRGGKKIDKDLKACGYMIKEKDLLSAGKSATRAAKRLLKINSEYKYSVKGKDRYGRSICVVDLKSDMTFNELMILNGYAAPYRYYMNRNELSHYEGLLYQARENNVGLWKDSRRAIECMDKAREGK